MDPTAGGLHQGAQPKRCIFDAVHMAATDQVPNPNNALATREPSTHGPRTMPNQFTYYRWRKEFGGLKTDQVKRLKELEKENERLRKAVSDLTLEKLILREAASGNF